MITAVSRTGCGGDEVRTQKSSTFLLRRQAGVLRFITAQVGQQVKMAVCSPQSKITF
jgi:hypothetical protein